MNASMKIGLCVCIGLMPMVLAADSACPDQKCTEEGDVAVSEGEAISAVIRSPQQSESSLLSLVHVEPCCQDRHGDLNRDDTIDSLDVALFLRLEIVGVQYNEEGALVGFGGEPWDRDRIEWSSIETKEVEGKPCVNVPTSHQEYPNDPVVWEWTDTNFDITTPGTDYYVRGRAYNPPNTGPMRKISDSRTHPCENAEAVCEEECWEWEGYDTVPESLTLEMPITVKEAALKCYEPQNWNPEGEEVSLDIRHGFFPMNGQPGVEAMIASPAAAAGNVYGRIGWKRIFEKTGACATPLAGTMPQHITPLTEGDTQSRVSRLIASVLELDVKSQKDSTVYYNCGLQGDCNYPKLEVWQKRFEGFVDGGAVWTRIAGQVEPTRNTEDIDVSIWLADSRETCCYKETNEFN